MRKASRTRPSATLTRTARTPTGWKLSPLDSNALTRIDCASSKSPVESMMSESMIAMTGSFGQARCGPAIASMRTWAGSVDETASAATTNESLSTIDGACSLANAAASVTFPAKYKAENRKRNAAGSLADALANLSPNSESRPARKSRCPSISLASLGRASAPREAAMARSINWSRSATSKFADSSAPIRVSS